MAWIEAPFMSAGARHLADTAAGAFLLVYINARHLNLSSFVP
jgi:hypothetical protein